MIRSTIHRLKAGPALAALAIAFGAASPVHADDLQGALAAAYATNPDLAAARANQRATDEGVPIARAPGLPSLNGTATYTEFLKVGPNAFIAPQRLMTVDPQLNVPIYSGGAVRNSLAADFNAPPRWVEGDSLNTRENAERAQALLAADSIRHVYLVTHAWHMPRARRAFEAVGLEVVAAPTGYTSITPSPLAWVPSGHALRHTYLATREWLGQAWYRLNSATRG
jgi:uncharacterized SAM-binding protein YcdF (DUF218 family)